jgi:hypothetical protein
MLYVLTAFVAFALCQALSDAARSDIAPPSLRSALSPASRTSDIAAQAAIVLVQHVDAVQTWLGEQVCLIDRAC